jgi:hypothetical protein
MHFDVLVEDLSGKRALDILIPKIIGDMHTFRVHPYKGIGVIPRNLKSTVDASKRILLDQLPKLLRGYGNTYAGYPDDSPAVVILVCDLDDKCLKLFRQQLFSVLNDCNPAPETRFCIAVEEGEAWFLGDIPAIKAAYPKAKDKILNSYSNDSICGTWECLADAVFPGGHKKLSKKGWQATGTEKSTWSEKISPLMDVENNKSPSFLYFRNKLHELIKTSG